MNTLFCTLGVRRLYKNKAKNKSKDIKCDGEDKYVLISDGVDHDSLTCRVGTVLNELSGMVNNIGCYLVSGKSCKSPCGKGDSVDC